MTLRCAWRGARRAAGWCGRRCLDASLRMQGGMHSALPACGAVPASARAPAAVRAVPGVGTRSTAGRLCGSIYTQHKRRLCGSEGCGSM